jgi:hypothetical protein
MTLPETSRAGLVQIRTIEKSSVEEESPRMSSGIHTCAVFPYQHEVRCEVEALRSRALLGRSELSGNFRSDIVLEWLRKTGWEWSGSYYGDTFDTDYILATDLP